MKTIPVTEGPQRVGELVERLAVGGLVCIPVRGAYRIVADARSEAAVTRLAQSKRRSHNRPALIAVADLNAASEVVDGTKWSLTQRLAKKFWPGPLTIVLPPSDRFPAKVRKVLTRQTGTLGVRVSDDPLVTALVKQLDSPLLVSSANIEKKPGASSAATVKQRFDRTVDIWIDAGDLVQEPPSTLVEIVSEESWNILREGAVTEAAIQRELGHVTT